MNVRRLPLACLFSATLVSRLATAEDGPSLVPYAQQSAFLFLSDSVTAGGIGGGVGAQGTYQSNYVAQLDLNALWMLGNSYAIRLALGYQRDATWCPAIWLTTGTKEQRLEKIGFGAVEFGQQTLDKLADYVARMG